MWKSCFQLIFFGLLSATEVNCKHQTDTNHESEAGWNETVGVIVQSLSKTFAQFFRAFLEYESIGSIWDQLVTSYGALLDAQSLTLSQAVFASLTEILYEVQTASGAHRIELEPAWTIWRDHSPTTYKASEKADNHAALTMYLQYLRQLHDMLPRGFNAAQAETVILHLRWCITEATPVLYGSDVDDPTMVQKLVLENIRLVPTSDSRIGIGLVEEIGHLVTLAFQAEGNDRPKGKTFVALSKAAMDVLADVVKQHSVRVDVTTSLILASSLHSLKVPIQLKYRWQREGKGIPTWRKATSTALSILDADLLRRYRGDIIDQQKMWTPIVEINDGIAAADTERCDSIQDIGAAQAFDIESFLHLQRIIIPSIGSPSIPGKVRQDYVKSLFEHSIIHEPHPDDLARPDQELLDGLRSKHVGRVQDLPPKRRSKMSYVLLDQLFDLVAVHDGSKERVKLAQAAAPYLVLRVGLVLKAYVCDQPLRGRMPQPLSQKREMHYVLKRLVELDSEPKAMPETSGVQSEHKKHMFLLFGLITKALKAAWRDEEMSARLREVLEAAGTDFGF